MDRIGYSTKINDPAMARYIKNTNQWSLIFSLFLAFVAVLGFFIYGEQDESMGNPEALYVGFTIGGMFILIALYQIFNRNKSITWDGIVVDKNIKSVHKYVKSLNNFKDILVYKIIIRSDSGQSYEITVEDDDTLYNYYQIGNRVRHHKGLNSYEKYDKTGDTIVFCNACASLNDIKDDYCFRCKCPLLK